MALASRIAVGLVVERHRHEDRPEDLLLEDLHVLVDVGDDRRLEEVAVGHPVGPVAARENPGALRRAPTRCSSSTRCVVLGADQRPELGVRVERVADADVRRALGDRRDELLVERALDEQPRARRAALAVHA